MILGVGEIPKNSNNSAKSKSESKIFFTIVQWPKQVRRMTKIGVENIVGLSL